MRQRMKASSWIEHRASGISAVRVLLVLDLALLVFVLLL